MKCLQQSGHAAIDDEKRRYRALAKKLKLRRKGRTAALGDGLDDFTAGITAAGMTSSDSEADSGAAHGLTATAHMHTVRQD